MLPVKVEPPLIEMEDFPPIVYWAWPEFSKEPPMMSPVKVIPSEKEAVAYAINNATPGSLVTMCSDVVSEALAQVMAYKEEEANRLYEFHKEDIPNL